MPTPSIQPLPPAELDALRRITSPTVANAIELFDVRPRSAGYMSPEIRCLFPELCRFTDRGAMVGYAVTATYRAELPPAGRRANRFDFWDYILSIPAPRVLVMQDLDRPTGIGAYWGEVQANIHKALGCLGVITDGGVRDLDEVRALGFQFFARHVSVSHAYVHLVDFGLPVKVGGLVVRPGDIIHADQHGALTVPREVAGRIPAAVAELERKERELIALCQSPEFSPARLREIVERQQQGKTY